MTEQATLIAPPEGMRGTVPLSAIIGDEAAIPSASLIESMMKHGLFNPVILERRGLMSYVVIAGRRRVAAARHLGWEWVESVSYAAGEVNPSQVSLIENSVRSANPISEFADLMALHAQGLTEQEITRLTGMNAATQRKRMKLGRLIPDVMDRVKRGDIAIGVAEEMTTVGPDLQRAVIDDHPEGRITAADVRQAKTVGQQAAWSTLDLPNDGIVVGSVAWRQQAESHLEAALSVVPADDPRYHDMQGMFAVLAAMVRGEDDEQPV